MKSLITQMSVHDDYVEDKNDFGFAREDANEEDESQTKNHNVWDNEW